MTRPCVIVLGAAGFIGRNVCQQLAAAGYQVHGIGHGDWTRDEWCRWGLARWVPADIDLAALEDAAAGEKPTALVHCAGSGAVSQAQAMPFDDFQRSVCSTAAVLEFARVHCACRARVVTASSAAVYGYHGEIDVDESTELNPVSPYGFHRVASENVCRSYSRFFGVDVSVVRLFSVFGEGLRKQLLWDAMNKFSCGTNEFLGTGGEMRDWIHVEDAARLLCHAATQEQGSFEVYNGGNVKATTKDVLSRLARAAGVSLEPRFSGEAHVGNPSRLTACCGHARRKLQWSPQVELDDGLVRYADWFNRRAR